MGVATGCGFKEIYRFPHTTYPYSSRTCTFCSSIPTFLFIFYMHTHQHIYIYRQLSDTNGILFYHKLNRGMFN